jgi:hypothetical protein
MKTDHNKPIWKDKWFWQFVGIVAMFLGAMANMMLIAAHFRLINL